MQVNKLRRDIETLTKDKRNAEMSQRKMSEEKTQLEEEVERLRSAAKVRRRSVQKATNEAAQKSQELARIQRSGASIESAGSESRRRRSSRRGSDGGASDSSQRQGQGAEMFAQLAARAAEAERERLLDMLGSMHPAQSALVLRQAYESRDPLVDALGFEVANASEGALHQQLLDAVAAGSDGTVAAVGELFPDTTSDYDDDDDDDDEADEYQDEDAWIHSKKASS
jgi:hypothetical protein